MKKALVLNAINPGIGGVLIRGEKGTAKSTAVRALADVLPEIEVVAGCPFQCNPADPPGMCDICLDRLENGEHLETKKRKVPVITLPLGATEDRVVGSIAIERAIKEGIRALEPGILAEVNRGILYIDEVNLLDDHVADVLLDAAAMGENVVEREGISVAHPARFILVGTMNPEEGELRPQLLDRFGLQVTVDAIGDVDQRMEIVRIAESFATNPVVFAGMFDGQQAGLQETISRARYVLPDVRLGDDLLRLIAETCSNLGIRTHRAEITVARTARTIAAFHGRTDVTREDIMEAMELALPHRMRRKPFEEPKLSEDQLREAMEPSKPEQQPPPEHRHGDRQEQQGSQTSGEPPVEGQPRERPGLEKVFPVGSPIDPAGMRERMKKDRLERRSSSGRRAESLAATSAGQYIGSSLTSQYTDIALDATIRAAAPFQPERNTGDRAIRIEPGDLREKVRVKRVSAACVFIVDASGSMGSMQRMEAAKGAVCSLLGESYRNRDRVGMVAFRGDRAEVVLPLCRSVELAMDRLREVPTGGKTPLPAGLLKAYEVLLSERRRNAEVIPMAVVITDGRGNVSLNGSVKDEILQIAGEMKDAGIHTVVIDTENTKRSFVPMELGYCREIAEASGGRYYRISDLSPGEVAAITGMEKESLFSGT
jgi:magnesium chelatase subunit D